MPTNRKAIFIRELLSCGFQTPFLRLRLEEHKSSFDDCFQSNSEQHKKAQHLIAKLLLSWNSVGSVSCCSWNLLSRFGYLGLHTEFSCVQIHFRIKGKWSHILKLTCFTVLQYWHVQHTVSGEFQTCQHIAHTAETAVLIVSGSHRNKAEIISFHHWWDMVVTLSFNDMY